jgi:DNA modification methylase
MKLLTKLMNKLSSRRKRKKRANDLLTQRPFKHLRSIMLAYTNESDYVLEPFFDSGTTYVAVKLRKEFYINRDESRIYTYD